MKKIIFLSLLFLGSAGALVMNLGANEIQAALTDARQMGNKENGYILGKYLLQAYNQDVILKPNSPEVDGIVISTPYEGLRYEAYLSELEGQPLKVDQANAIARRVNKKLAFRIYSHSPYAVEAEEEQWQLAYRKNTVEVNNKRSKSYLDFYPVATLIVNGRNYTSKASIDGPYRDNFTLPSGEAVTRNLGVITYSFAVPETLTRGNFTLSFKDSQGKTYSVKGNLENFE